MRMISLQGMGMRACLLLILHFQQLQQAALLMEA